MDNVDTEFKGLRKSDVSPKNKGGTPTYTGIVSRTKVVSGATH